MCVQDTHAYERCLAFLASVKVTAVHFLMRILSFALLSTVRYATQSSIDLESGQTCRVNGI